MKIEDAIISEFLRSIGPWNESIVIGGGYALLIYKLYFADPGSISPVGTRDIDSLIPRKISEHSNKSVAKHLSEAGFTHVFKDVKQPPTEAYVKEINGVEVEIEFLTDSATRLEKNKNVCLSGVVAQSLSYLSLSLERTKEFQTHSEEIGWVVSPGAWIFHKGLTFTKRRSKAKKCKDLYGIWYVATQLGDFSNEALIELELLGKQYNKWWKTFTRNINGWLEETTPEDIIQLESQDPSGRFKKAGFIRVLENLDGIEI